MKKPEVTESKIEGSDGSAVEAKLKAWFPDLSAAIVSSLVQFHAETLKATKSLALIASNTIPKAESVHIADSVFASRLILKSLVVGKPIFDVGSGNGYPGIVLSLLKPDLPVVIVDRDDRKLEFCAYVAKLLNLKNLTVQKTTLEHLADRSAFNLVVRGNSPFARALLAGRKPIVKGGHFFHMKSDGWANELAQMPSQLFSHWSPHLLGQYRLPDSASDMFVVMTEKTSD